jgi:universal stress protein E
MGVGDRLLVVVDPTTESQPAVDRAVWLARRLDVPLELFICDYDQVLLTEQGIDADAVHRAKHRFLDRDYRKLRELARVIANQGIEVSFDVRWHHPLDEGVILKAMESRPALLLKDTHYHSVLKRSIFSNTDWNLIRGCPVPLLLVKARDLSAAPKIMAAVDPLHAHDKPADLDCAILGIAADLSRRTGASLHVFHAFDPAPAVAAAADSMMTPISTPVSVITDALETRHRNAFSGLLENCSIDNATTHFHQGVPQELLVRLAEQLDVDLIVMGAVSRSALKRIFVGSTAERVLDKLPCDVLVIKTGESVERYIEELCPAEDAVSP